MAESLRPSSEPQSQPYELQGDVYSWGKTARLIAEPAFLDVYNNTPGDLVAVDICSSYPLFRQIMTGQHVQRMRLEAKKAVGTFSDDLHAPAQKNRLPFTSTLDRNRLATLRRVLGPQHAVGRRLINAPVFDILTNPPPASLRTAEMYAEVIFAQLMRSDAVIEDFVEPYGKAGDKGNWVFIAPVATGVTLPEIVGPLLADDTPQFLWDVANYFGSRLEEVHNVRRVSFVSLDKAPFDYLVGQARTGFPPEMQGTRFFKSAQEPGRHVQADVSDLPFAKVDFLSSIEGWPYWCKKLGAEGNVNVARQISRILAPGGKAVIFSWRMDPDNEVTRAWLKAAESVWKQYDLKIDLQGFTRDQLLQNMSDRERMLTHHSPLFHQTGIFTSLTVSRL